MERWGKKMEVQTDTGRIPESGSVRRKHRWHDLSNKESQQSKWDRQRERERERVPMNKYRVGEKKCREKTQNESTHKVEITGKGNTAKFTPSHTGQMISVLVCPSVRMFVSLFHNFSFQIGINREPASKKCKRCFQLWPKWELAKRQTSEARKLPGTGKSLFVAFYSTFFSETSHGKWDKGRKWREARKVGKYNGEKE